MTGHLLSVESRLVNCLELSQLCMFLFVLLCRRKRLRNNLLILRRHPGVDVQSYSRLDKVKRNICSSIPIGYCMIASRPQLGHVCKAGRYILGTSVALVAILHRHYLADLSFLESGKGIGTVWIGRFMERAFGLGFS